VIHRDERFERAVEELVTELEAHTDAEIVVVATGRSAEYADVRYLCASVVAFATLAVLIELPVHVPPLWVMIDLVVSWFATAFICNADPILARLVRAKRKLEAVREAAAAAFHAEAVHGTPDRMGVLVYISALEGHVELIPDVGVEEKVPRGRWAKAIGAFRHDDLDHFLSGLREVGEVLSDCVPSTGRPDRVDLPNAPRVRK
jgi:uncharacterized membrane protein